MNEPVLEVQNVSKRFDMTQALDDVSLKLFPGQIHASCYRCFQFHDYTSILICRTVDLHWLLCLDWGKKGLTTNANIQE